MIEEGDVCETVCDKLEEDGVIEDAWELQNYMDKEQAMLRASRSDRMRYRMGLQWKQ